MNPFLSLHQLGTILWQSLFVILRLSQESRRIQRIFTNRVFFWILRFAQYDKGEARYDKMGILV